MSFHVIIYFAASVIILTHSKIVSVNGQCTTEGCAHDDLSVNIVTEIQQQIVQQNKQIQSNHDVMIASFQQLTNQHEAILRSLQAVDRRLEEHDVYIKQGQSFQELLNASFQEMKSQHDSVNSSLQSVDQRIQIYQTEIKNQTQQSWKLVSDIWNAVIYPVRDCSDIKARGFIANGVYEVCAGQPPSRVCTNGFCDMKTSNTALVFQRHKDGSVNFNRTWAEYREGFGNPDGEFWLGNEMLYLLTSKRKYKLRVDLEDWEGEKRYAEYSNFSISSSTNNYTLTVGNYSGNAGDSLNYHNGKEFTTYDNSGDIAARLYGGAWWYGRDGGFYANLNGIYHQRYENFNDWKGIHWYHWHNLGSYSLKATEMKLVPAG